MKRLPFISLVWFLLTSWIVSNNLTPNSGVLERTVSLMGTTLNIKLYDTEHDRAIRFSEEWIRIVEETEQQLSNWRDTSEVTRLNKYPQDRAFKLSHGLCRIIPLLQIYNTQTDGTFDPGIGQLLKIWGHYGKPRIPARSEIESALQASGIHKIQFNQKECTVIRTSDVLLDAGAFGKGEALERILNHANANQSAPFVMDFGGQLLVFGKSQNHTGWEAELAHPVQRDEGSGVRIRFQSGSLSTSGGSERDRMINGKRIGHILNPQTGEPALSLGSVTVWHESPFTADILSTSLYVLGPEKGLGWANEHSIAACYLKGENARVSVRKSNNFNKLLN